MTESLQILSTPDNSRPGTSTVTAQIQTDELTGGNTTADATVSAFLIVNGERVSSKEGTDVSGTTFEVTFQHNFPEGGEYDIIVRAVVFYSGISDSEIDENNVKVRDSRAIVIRPFADEPTDIGLDRGFKGAFSDRSDTIIENITTDSGVTLTFEVIDFNPYGNPTISVDSSARFAVHDILGGTTVRQKIGEKPREITVQGVCTEPVVRKVNQLNKAKLVSLNSDVIGDVVRCQVASTSTDPIEDGGAADMDGGEFLYDFSISLVEVGRTETE